MSQDTLCLCAISKESYRDNTAEFCWRVLTQRNQHGFCELWLKDTRAWYIQNQDSDNKGCCWYHRKSLRSSQNKAKSSVGFCRRAPMKNVFIEAIWKTARWIKKNPARIGTSHSFRFSFMQKRTDNFMRKQHVLHGIFDITMTIFPILRLKGVTARETIQFVKVHLQMLNLIILQIANQRNGFHLEFKRSR